MAELTNYEEFIETLPDGSVTSVHVVTPLTNNDTINIPRLSNDTRFVPVVAFNKDTGVQVEVANFYLGPSDKVRITNQQGNTLVVVTLCDHGTKNYIRDDADDAEVML